MRKIIILALLLAGCSKNEPSDDAIKAALNKYNEDIHSGCFKFDIALPGTLNEMKHNTLSGMQLDAYAKAGLVVASQEGKGVRYELTPEGKNYYNETDATEVGLTIRKVKHGEMCLGKLQVDNITQVIPVPQGSEIKAFYMYKIDNLAQWANNPELQHGFGLMAKLVNGQHKDERSEMLYKTGDGWMVRDMRTNK